MNKPSAHSFTRLFHTRWFFALNLVLIVVVTVSFTREMIHSRDIATQIQSLQKQSQELQTQHLAINDLKNAVQTESFVESEARLKLGLKKPGESLIIIKNEKDSSLKEESGRSETLSLLEKEDAERRGVDNPSESSQKSLANSTKWWYYFFNKQVYRENE